MEMTERKKERKKKNYVNQILAEVDKNQNIQPVCSSLSCLLACVQQAGPWYTSLALYILLYFTLIISQKKKNIQIHVHKKTKMPREGQNQEQVPFQMATQATMYDKYTKNLKFKFRLKYLTEKDVPYKVF